MRYLLEGSVRRAGERVRITAQLIDATSGDHLWAERYDRALDDIFAVQDEVVATIAATLAVRIHVAGLERAKRQPTEDLAAYECVLRGRERLAAYGPEANAAARALFARAVALDPELRACPRLSGTGDLQRGMGGARRAAASRVPRACQPRGALDPTDSRCHRILAMILLEAREFERAGYHADRAVALNPHDGDAAAYRGYILCFLGRPEEALSDSRRALALTRSTPTGTGVCLAAPCTAPGATRRRSWPSSERPQVATSIRPGWPRATPTSARRLWRGAALSEF